MVVNVNEIKKNPLLATAVAQQPNAQATEKVTGEKFLADGDKGKAQNTAVFKSMDAGAQEAIKGAIGDKNWADPKKVAAALTQAGYQATTGKEGDKTFLEVTGKDGTKQKIWDIGGDNGIGTQDIDFNGKLGDFKKEIATDAKAPAAEAQAPVANALNPLVQNATADPTAKKDPFKADKADDQDAIRQLLRQLLKAQGVEDNQIEAKIDQLIKFSNNPAALV